MRGYAIDPTAEHGKDWWTERVMELCSIGGCGNGAVRYVLMPITIGGYKVELEVWLCDYHRGWHDAA